MFIALVAATVAFLPWLAHRQLYAHLRAQAAHELALFAAGQSPWQWRFDEPEDIVAGRVFGAREISFDQDGLHVLSDGQPFEVGLPLARPLDLSRFPLLHIDASTQGSAVLRIVVRRTLDAPEVLGSATPIGDSSTVLDLRHDALPERAAMLRLRFEMPAGQMLRLRAAALELPPHAEPAPIRELAEGSVEQQMLAVRKIRDERPAAIIVPPGSAGLIAPAIDGLGFTPNVFVAGLFAGVLLLARVRPPRNARVRACAELALVLAIPIWLIVGGHFNGRVDRAQMILIAAAILYALSLGWPRTWKLNGSARAWMAAATVVLVAACLGAALHRGTSMRVIDSGHLVRYLGWALIQQYLICAVCLPRWDALTGNAAATVYLSALCFALLHTPNATLMLATFAGGVCWCTIYRRERALLPLAASHALSALALIALLPPEILLSAEVSARFFQ